MKSMLLCMFLCACGSVNSQTAVQQPVSHPQYHDIEVQCAQQSITNLYDHAEKYGQDIFIFHVKPSDMWNDYLKCILGH